MIPSVDATDGSSIVHILSQVRVRTALWYVRKSLYIIVELKTEQLYGNSTAKYAHPAVWQSFYKEDLIHGLCYLTGWQTADALQQSHSKTAP
ncbi:MAG: hypothetical protein MJY74_08860 [Bacteroidaceae bacterium]|nr:hypothetical protein [Bacteroidaceae bacterium]